MRQYKVEMMATVPLEYAVTVLVTGGRVRANRVLIRAALEAVSTNLSWPRNHLSRLIHGDARGTDTICGEWGREQGYTVIRVPIDPNKDGFKNDAPLRRNVRMALFKPDLLLAFPGGNGTLHMIRTAKAKGIPILEVERDENSFIIWRYPYTPTDGLKATIMHEAVFCARI